jgi:hypothetical protein
MNKLECRAFIHHINYHHVHVQKSNTPSIILQLIHQPSIHQLFIHYSLILVSVVNDQVSFHIYSLHDTTRLSNPYYFTLLSRYPCHVPCLSWHMHASWPIHCLLPRPPYLHVHKRPTRTFVRISAWLGGGL